MKRVFITGGSRGIGKACVEEFFSRGWRVVFTYRNSRDAAKKLCLGREDRIEAVKLDLSDPESVKKTVDALGAFDAVVNNAGESRFSLLWDDTVEETERLFAADFISSHEILRVLLKKMLNDGGSAVNVASVWGQCGASCESLYSAAKGAVISLTRALALELAPCGIRVNCVSPGVIDTDMNARFIGDERKELENRIPAGRFGTPEEVAALVAFLCSDKASYITAQNLCPNGGLLV